MSSDKEQRPPTKNQRSSPSLLPPRSMRLVNPLMRVIIRSRFGGHLEPLAVLRVTGRRTGIRREFVAGVHMVDGIATVFTADLGA